MILRGKVRAGRQAAFVHRMPFPLRKMRLIKQVLWIAAFIVVTFFWMVAFQHGFTPGAIAAGAQEELRGIVALLNQGK